MKSGKLTIILFPPFASKTATNKKKRSRRGKAEHYWLSRVASKKKKSVKKKSRIITSNKKKKKKTHGVLDMRDSSAYAHETHKVYWLRMTRNRREGGKKKKRFFFSPLPSLSHNNALSKVGKTKVCVSTIEKHTRRT